MKRSVGVAGLFAAVILTAALAASCDPPAPMGPLAQKLPGYNPGCHLSEIAAAQGAVYWLDYCQQQLSGMDSSGTALSPVPLSDSVFNLRSDGTDLYWVTFNQPTAFPSVRRHDFAADAGVLVADNLQNYYGMGQLSIDKGRAHWAEWDAGQFWIASAPTDGGQPPTRIEVSWWPRPITVTSQGGVVVVENDYILAEVALDGTVQDLAFGVDGWLSVGVGDTLYWMQWGPEQWPLHELWRKKGSAAAERLKRYPLVEGIAADERGAYVYAFDSYDGKHSSVPARIEFVPDGPGEPKAIGRIESAELLPGFFALTPTHVFLQNVEGIFVVEQSQGSDGG